MTERYAIVVRVRMQVGRFTDYPESVNTTNNILVDLANHPQKDEIKIDWFYDPASNTFLPDGEIQYPVVEETPKPTQLDRIEEAVNKTQQEIAEAAVDSYTEELLERGIL